MEARCNPFASDRLLEFRYRFSEDDWEGLYSRLEQNNFRGAIVGPEGSGKTTLLEDLAAYLSRRGFRVHLLRARGGAIDLFPRALSKQDIVLLDSAEQLNALSWLQFRWHTRRAGGVVITAHRAGRLPNLIRCSTTSSLLGEIVEFLGDPYGIISRDTVERAFEKHAGNLRLALFEFYDLYAEQPSYPQPVHVYTNGSTPSASSSPSS